MRGATGRYEPIAVAGETAQAFVPAPLPPVPPLAPSLDDIHRYERANRALGRLDGLSPLLPDVALVVYGYVRREAVLSSKIEGTQSSLSDLLMFEHEAVPGVPVDDVREVSNYVAALEHGLARLPELPLSRRLLCEIHAKLLAHGRGAQGTPGEVRRTQNWIGGDRPSRAQFVPPPPQHVDDALAALEHFLHDPTQPALIKAGLAHVQFETIHPFLDGNGRLGRLLITLLLCAEGALRQPLLYLSLYFKEHRDEYYERLQRVRTHGEWEAWLAFFMRGVDEVATAAAATAVRIVETFRDHRAQIGAALGRRAGNVLRVHDHLQRRPLFSIASATAATGVSKPTVAAAVRALEDLGLARQVGDARRDRVFSYAPYLALLSEGT